MTALLRRAPCWVALALTMICWSFSITYARAAFECGGRAVLRLNGYALDAAAVETLFDTQARLPSAVKFAVWRQDDRKTVENEAFGRSCTASVLLVHGDASLIMPSGAALSDEDRSGCLIDRETALTLYGDDNPAGAQLLYDGRVYTVRGVFAAPAGTVVLRAPSSGTMTFDRITLDTAGQISMREAARQFAARHSLTDPLIITTESIAAWGGLFMRLPGIVMGGALICALLMLAHSRHAWPVQMACWIFAAAAALVLYLWIMDVHPAVPQDLVPTRWSDFEFWARLFEERRRELMEYIWMKKERPDILLLTRLGNSALAGYGALFFWSGARRSPVTGLGELLCTLAVCLLGAFGGVCLAGGTAWMLWICAPLFFIFRRFLETTEKGRIV